MPIMMTSKDLWLLREFIRESNLLVDTGQRDGEDGQKVMRDIQRKGWRPDRNIMLVDMGMA